MAAQLPLVSFLGAGLLCFFLPIRRVYSSIPSVSLVSWLIICNTVNGANTVVWSGNADVRVSVWCDIVTIIVLGANMALPAACLSIGINLERISSDRKLTASPRIFALVEMFLCNVMPIIYVCLHFIVQIHRFDIVRDFGPFSSTHFSVLGLLFTWMLPLLVCFLSLAFTAVSIHHSYKRSAPVFSTYLASRAPSCSPSIRVDSTSSFLRRVGLNLVLTAILAVFNLFSLFLVSPIEPISPLRRQWSRIHIVEQEAARTVAQVMWWRVPVISLVFVVLSLVMANDELKDSVGWWNQKIGKWAKTWRERKAKRQMKNSTPKEQIHLATSSLDTSSWSSRPSLPDLELQSGWDDMLKRKPYPSPSSPIRKQQQQQRARQARESTCKSPTSSTSSCTTLSTAHPPTPPPRPSPPPSISSDDEVFIKSTLSYLQSPPAQALGFVATPVASSISSRPTMSALPSSSLLPPPPPSAKAKTVSKQPQTVPSDADSAISSLIDVNTWPAPPPTLTSLSPRFSIHSVRSLRDSRPFQGPTIAEILPEDLEVGMAVSPPADVTLAPQYPKAPVMPQASTRGFGLRRALSKDSLSSVRSFGRDGRMSPAGFQGKDVIYMMVVQETTTTA